MPACPSLAQNHPYQPLHYLPLYLPPLSVLPGAGDHFLHPYGVWKSAVSSPSGSGRSHYQAAKRLLLYLELKKIITSLVTQNQKKTTAYLYHNWN